MLELCLGEYSLSVPFARFAVGPNPVRIIERGFVGLAVHDKAIETCGTRDRPFPFASLARFRFLGQHGTGEERSDIRLVRVGFRPPFATTVGTFHGLASLAQSCERGSELLETF